MRIRSTKPEFWRSERIASVSWDARLILKGLESFVDDNGVGRDDIALIVGDVFPRDMLASPRETVARVSEGISELHWGGLLWRYEASSTRLLYVSFWDSIQRIDKPGVGRFPRPDGTMNYRDSEIRESLARARETVAPRTEEQRNRGTGENNPPTPLPAEVVGTRDAELRNDGRGKALARFGRMNECATSPASWDIAKAFTASNGAAPLEEQAKIAASVEKCLRAGVSPEQITAGLTLWAQSDSWAPSQIGAFVTKAGQRTAQPNVSKATQKAMNTHSAAEALIAGMEATR